MKFFYYLTSLIAIFILIACDGTNDISESLQSKSENDLELSQYKSDRAKEKCTTIQSGKIVTEQGKTIKVGYDAAGYNYQAQIYYGEPYPVGEWANWFLLTKWNDAWLSKQDCDGDGLLDSRYGYDSYKGSGAWVTNHWTHTHLNEDGKKCKVTIFRKYIAVPEGSYVEDQVFYNADGTEIGEYAFPDFALVQKVVNDPCAGIHGLQYKTPGDPGLGNLQ